MQKVFTVSNFVDVQATISFRDDQSGNISNAIVGLFSSRFKQRRDIGIEYFEGNVLEMRMCIAEYFTQVHKDMLLRQAASHGVGTSS